MLKCALHFRMLLVQLSKKLQESPCYTVKEILSLSEGLDASHSLGVGGSLMEFYILLHGKTSDVTLLTHHLEKKKKCDETDQGWLTKTYMFPFWFFCISTCRFLGDFVLISVAQSINVVTCTCFFGPCSWNSTVCRDMGGSYLIFVAYVHHFEHTIGRRK